MTSTAAIVWFRRDLRDFDHAALYHALKNHSVVHCVFVFDRAILDTLADKQDRRVEFIWESARELKAALQNQGSDLRICHGIAETVIPQLAQTLNVAAVYCNRDYEPVAIARDNRVSQQLHALGIAFHTFKDQVIFEHNEVLTQSGKPYSIFTPYKNSHLKQLNDFYLKAYPIAPYAQHLAKMPAEAMPTLEELGFERTNLSALKLPTGMQGGESLFVDFQQRMHHYKTARDYPAIKGPSYLSVHLRFGTVSIRQLARYAWQMGGSGGECWLSELIWRDFYFQILSHNPDLQAGHTFKAEYQTLVFPNDKALFQAWCEGRTGYPLVDAAMRQLNQTGWMHNRLRMVTASFLVKDLLIDWRWGERYFAEKLIDFDFSANNGGWQWAASTGCDAQPYFRIFNPITQSEKFDPEGKFIRRYVPELAKLNHKEIHQPWQASHAHLSSCDITLGLDYPMPVVDHAVQRQLALALYQQQTS